MLRPIICALCAAGALGVGLHGASAAGGPASVRLSECVEATATEGGSAKFEGRMRAVEGTRRMWMRFTLIERFGSERPHRVELSDLKRWRKSRPGVRGFKFTQEVKGLRQGGVYHARVQFRWTDKHGNRIASSRHRSPRCRQPGGPPNLRVRAITGAFGDARETEVYYVTVVNSGDSEARKIKVQLTVDGDLVDEADAIDVLAPGEARTVQFTGPVCTSGVRAVVDPDNTVPEGNESDNQRWAACPTLPEAQPQ